MLRYSLQYETPMCIASTTPRLLLLPVLLVLLVLLEVLSTW